MFIRGLKFLSQMFIGITAFFYSINIYAADAALKYLLEIRTSTTNDSKHGMAACVTDTSNEYYFLLGVSQGLEFSEGESLADALRQFYRNRSNHKDQNSLFDSLLGIGMEGEQLLSYFGVDIEFLMTTKKNPPQKSKNPDKSVEIFKKSDLSKPLCSASPLAESVNDNESDFVHNFTLLIIEKHKKICEPANQTIKIASNKNKSKFCILF